MLKTRYHSFIITIFIFFNGINLMAQTKDRNYYLEISKALGYSYGVNLSLDYITDNFTEVSKKAMMCKLDFKLAHGDAISSLEDELSTYMKLEKTEFEKMFMEEISKQYTFDEVTLEDAKSFVDNFTEERIKGNHEVYGEFVASLLRHNNRFISNPYKEFQEGYKQKFNSDGNVKSLGLKFTVEFPKSWKLSEGKRPHILNNLSSSDQSCDVTIQVRDFLASLDSTTLTKAEKDYVKSDAYANDTYNESFTNAYGLEYIEGLGFKDVSNYTFSKSKIDGQPCMFVKAYGVLNTGLVEIKVYSISCLLLYKNYCISFGVIINNLNDNLSEIKANYELLSEHIIRSLVLNSKWK